MAEERALRLPGDELVPEPQWTYNQAISIDARRSAVWSWLVQLGQGRGGFSSYEELENLVGCQIHNVMEFRPELQQLQAGTPSSPMAAPASGLRSLASNPATRWSWVAAEREGLTGDLGIPPWPWVTNTCHEVDGDKPCRIRVSWHDRKRNVPSDQTHLGLHRYRAQIDLCDRVRKQTAEVPHLHYV